MILARIKRSDRFEKSKIISGKKTSFTWEGTTYNIVPSLCYRTRWILGIKVFALDYSKGYPDPVDYFSQENSEDTETFRLTPDLVADTYKQIIEGINPKILLILVGISIIITIIAAFLIYNTGQKIDELTTLVNNIR